MKLEPDDFKLELNTVWRFPKRGDWATHDAKYPGNWSPFIPRNIILRYSLTGDLVLDQFVGGGTTLVEAKLLNRNCIGVDVNESALVRCHEKCNFKIDNMAATTIRNGDARDLNFIANESIDLICTHPPYANIIKYSEDNGNDLSRCKIKEFLYEMESVAGECFRVLKDDKYCAILIGDTRSKGHVVQLGFSVMNIFINTGFYLKEIIIKEQFNCKSTGYWKESSIKYNFLLLAHEYLFVFKK
ncbi:MAG: methyltransferase domain-containing protein [Spirochaetaceae bacterium]|jgi:DNA modification methylase|nr:methyltransferase domain-containing protein [Spirochaetaceae bacterium]